MDSVNTVLKHILDGSAMRNRALANNIANADTPGYKRREVDFMSELRSAMESREPSDLSTWRPNMTTARRDHPIRLESEFAALSENQLLYHTSSDVLSRRYARLRTAIFGRPS